MASFEVMEAYRPIDSIEWIEEVDKAAREIFGDGVLDFQNGELAEKGVVLLEGEEQARIYNSMRSLGHLSSVEAFKAIERKMPITFSLPADPSVRSRLRLKSVGKGQGNRVLMARVSRELTFAQERTTLTAVIDAKTKRQLPWASPLNSIGVNLAVIDPDSFLDRKDMRRLAEHLPNNIHVERGDIEMATVELFLAKALDCTKYKLMLKYT